MNNEKASVQGFYGNLTKLLLFIYALFAFCVLILPHTTLKPIVIYTKKVLKEIWEGLASLAGVVMFLTTMFFICFFTGVAIICMEKGGEA